MPLAPDFHLLFNASPNALVVLRPDSPRFTIVAATDAYLRATTKSRDQLIGRGLFEVFPDPPRSVSTPGPRNFRASLDRAITTGQQDRLVAHQYSIRRDDGTESQRWNVVNTPLLDERGDVAYLLHLVDDVTDQARAEAEAIARRLRAVVEQTPLAVAVLTGPDHVYTLVSPRYARYGGGRELLGRPLREALPELEGQGLLETVHRVYTTGAAYTAAEQRVMLDIDGDGVPEEHFFNLGYQPLRDEAGNVYAVASTAYDVTDQVTARRTIESARGEALAASRAKSEFLAVMSHELRTPLNAIGGYAELLEMGIRGPVNEQQREDLARIQTSQRHLLGLINEVLNYAKLESGAVRYEMEIVTAHDALVAAEGMVTPQLRAKALQFRVELRDASLCVHADPEKLRQILANLLSNAVKFTDRGGHISLCCEEVAREGGAPRVAFIVRDSGIGIPADKFDAIFEPFVQVRSDLTRTAEGTGLGLAISRDLANGMNGELLVESVEGEGSTFTLLLERAARPARHDNGADHDGER